MLDYIKREYLNIINHAFEDMRNGNAVDLSPVLSSLSDYENKWNNHMSFIDVNRKEEFHELIDLLNSYLLFVNSNANYIGSSSTLIKDIIDRLENHDDAEKFFYLNDGDLMNLYNMIRSDWSYIKDKEWVYQILSKIILLSDEPKSTVLSSKPSLLCRLRLKTKNL